MNNPPLLSCLGYLDLRTLCAARAQCQECFLLWLFKAAILLHELNLTKRFLGQDHSSTVVEQFFPDVGEGPRQSFSWGYSHLCHVGQESLRHWEVLNSQIHWYHLFSSFLAWLEVLFVLPHISCHCLLWHARGFGFSSFLALCLSGNRVYALLLAFE